MKIKHIRPNYENEEFEEKIINETMQRICRKLTLERNKGKRCI